MIFRIVFQTLGGHVHFRIWAGRTTQSLGLTNNVGENVMRIDEFAAFRQMLESGHTDHIVLFSNKTPVEPDQPDEPDADSLPAR